MSTIALRHILDPARPLTYGIVQAGPNVEGGVPYIRPADMSATQGVADEGGLLRTSPEIADAYARASIDEGDVVLSIGPSFGKVMVVPPSLQGANLTQGTARLAPNTDTDSRWLYWVLQAQSSISFWSSVVAGGTFRALNLGPLGETPVRLTPLAEQRRIADFLDDRVSGIDRIIAARREQVLATQAIEQAWITNDLVAPTDTWAPLRRRGVSVTTGPFGTVFAANEYVDMGVPMINPSHIQGGSLFPDDQHSVSPETAYRLRRHQLRQGDLVVSRKGDIGRTAMVHPHQDGWICGSDSIALHTADSRVLPNMLALLLSLDLVRDQLLSQSNAATMPSLNEGNLLSLSVPVLALDEQERRAQAALGSQQSIRTFARRANRSIDLLTEYKSSLITAAVTGEFDVTTAGSNIPG